MGTQPSRSNADDNYAGCGIAVVILLVIGALSQCSEKPKSDEQVAATAFSNTTGNAIATQSPIPIETVDRRSAKKAQRDWKVVSATEGLSGAMVYSQNCFEALTHQFSWERVDICGAFDLLVISRMDDTGQDTPSEAAYFDNETAAGRYLAAVTGAGEEAAKADLRLEVIQQQVNTANPPARTPEPTENVDEQMPDEDAGGEGGDVVRI